MLHHHLQHLGPSCEMLDAGTSEGGCQIVKSLPGFPAAEVLLTVDLIAFVLAGS